MIRIFLAIAAIIGGLSVAAGAFASHALKEHLSDSSLSIFETGARYQMYHALALLAVALLLTRTLITGTARPRRVWGCFYCRCGDFFRQFVRSQPHRHQLAGCHHPGGGSSLYHWLGLSGGCGFQF